MKFEDEIYDFHSSCSTLLCQSGGRRFVLFAGNLQQISLALFNETLQLSKERTNSRVVFVEFDQPYFRMREIVMQALRKEPGIFIFESLNDPMQLVLVEALLRKKFTVWAGVEACGVNDAMTNLYRLVQPPAGREHTIKEPDLINSNGAGLALRKIDHMLDGLEVVDLQINNFHKVQKRLCLPDSAKSSFSLNSLESDQDSLFGATRNRA